MRGARVEPAVLAVVVAQGVAEAVGVESCSRQTAASVIILEVEP